MLTLDLTNAPRWHDLVPGVRVQLRPLTTALMVATRSDPALVRRYILMLRKKLEIDPAAPVWVRTVRGFGYRLGTGPLKLPPELDKPSGNK